VRNESGFNNDGGLTGQTSHQDLIRRMRRMACKARKYFAQEGQAAEHAHGHPLISSKLMISSWISQLDKYCSIAIIAMHVKRNGGFRPDLPLWTPHFIPVLWRSYLPRSNENSGYSVRTLDHILTTQAQTLWKKKYQAFTGSHYTLVSTLLYYKAIKANRLSNEVIYKLQGKHPHTMHPTLKYIYYKKRRKSPTEVEQICWTRA